MAACSVFGYLLRTYDKAQGKMVLIASHSAEDIDLLCDTVCEMDGGELIKVKGWQLASAPFCGLNTAPPHIFLRNLSINDFLKSMPKNSLAASRFIVRVREVICGLRLGGSSWRM